MIVLSNPLLNRHKRPPLQLMT